MAFVRKTSFGGPAVFVEGSPCSGAKGAMTKLLKQFETPGSDPESIQG